MTTDLALGKKRADELGLKLSRESRDAFDRYLADDIHKLLGEAREVFQYKPGGMSGDWSHVIDEEFGGARKYANQALVIGIRPIKQESREQKMEALLSEAVKWLNGEIPPPSLREKIKSLLGEK